MMRIGLVGFGKTGKAVASVLLQCEKCSLEWVLRRSTLLENRSIAEYLGVDIENSGLILSTAHISVDELLDSHPVDIIIDFSSNSGIHTYGEAAARRNIKIISAISHYGEEEKHFLNELSERTTVFWSPNITLGVNFLMFSAKFLKKIAPWVDIEIIEEHFKGKEGVSGTAIKIAESLDLENSNINSVRAGGIVGKHEIIFGFPYQTVRLIHESISREAFGNGVLFVAENLIDKGNGFFSFEDLMMAHLDI
jgi:4-hydroxy-tetrahydrodipicolinate reductase